MIKSGIGPSNVRSFRISDHIKSGRGRLSDHLSLGYFIFQVGSVIRLSGQFEFRIILSRVGYRVI
jgi:hypothetical protein